MELIQTNNVLANQSKHAERFIKLANTQFINVQMRKDEVLSEHHSKEAVIIIVRKGSVAFNFEGEKTIVTTENVLKIEPNEIHEVLALEDTDFIIIKVI